MYVAAPAAVRVVLLPIQIEGLAAVAVTVGGGPTITVTVEVPTQPAALVPVKVYVVVVNGVTVQGEPTCAPGFQRYVVAPEPVKVTGLPVQIEGEEAVATTVGVGFTVIVLVAVEVHPLAAVPVTV